MIPADQIERARNVRLEDELARRGLVLRGHSERAGPCLVCGGTDRFSINTKKQIWNCRGCRKGGSVIDLVRHVDAVSFADAVGTLAGDQARTKYAEPALKVRTNHRDQQQDDEQRRLGLAHRLFGEADKLGPEAITYFRSRGINIAAVPDHGGLRWHRACLFDAKHVGCIVARFTDAITNEPKGIWRRPIDGSKPKALGPTAGAVIRLWADDAVTCGLVIGEGVETTLSAATRITHKNTLLQPAWATGSAGNMAKLAVLAGVESLTILVDHDANGAGQRAAEECAARWSAAGCEIELLTPTLPGFDFNDLARHAS